MPQKNQKNTRPRVPLPVPIDLFGARSTLQVNHCRMPDCDNYGIPARHQHGKTGPSPDRDMYYKVHSTNKGRIPSVRCKSCKDNPPMKSNASIAAELNRLIDLGGIRTLEEVVSCRNPECENKSHPIATHRHCYQKWGRGPGGAQKYRCKACGRQVVVSNPVRLHKLHRTLAVDVFSRVANKVAIRRAVNGARLKSNKDYYRILDFIESRCRAFSGACDRAMVDGRLKLPSEINLQSDAQVYTLNWISRLDRRNVELSSYCTVDGDSGFVFGLHSNFDPGVDPFEINARAAARGELQIPEAFREHARYWLAGDELHGGRAMSRNIVDRQELLAQIETLYTQAASRDDVENIELQHFDSSLVTPELKAGLQIHMPYTTYAHWLLLRRILTGAGVEKIQANMDIDSSSRAAFLCAFVDEVRRGDAHLFYVRYSKYLTVDERRGIVAASRRTRNAFAKKLPEDVRKDAAEVARRMMKDSLQHVHEVGKWRDQWYHHPLPTTNEPRKIVAWMTPNDSIDEDRKADMYLQARIAAVDNVFQRTRRLFNAFERPIGTSSGYNRAWHGYQPYSPEMIQKYLTIFRTVHNFVHTGETKDGKTPAMRLGFAKKPLAFEDILWPGEKVPMPPRRRRKGLALAF